jgi:PAS domain S-box-containing protein
LSDPPTGNSPGSERDLGFLADGGQLGILIRGHDWANTTLGLPERWPQPLRTAIRLILNSGHPMYIWWGPELLCFYNDAYSASIGPERHPGSIGLPARQVWAEIWHLIGPQIEQVMGGRGATWHENQLVPITRHGRLEDVYWTYSYSPLDDSQAPNGVGGVLVVCAETTPTVLAEKRRAEEVVRQREMFAQAPGFMIVMSGPTHRVEFVNDSHRRLFGSDDWGGRSIRDAFPDVSGQGFFELLDGVFATGRTYRGRAVPARFRRPEDGVEETRFLDFIYAPTHDGSGTINGVFCEGFDATQQIAAETALRRQEEQLRLATEAADVGLWDVDLVDDKLFWPPRVKAMFGISADADVSMADFYTGLHPEDRERTTAAFSAAVDPAQRSLYDVEYRTVGKEDDVLRWVAAKGRGIFDEAGKCVRVIGTAIDISQRKTTEQLLRLSEERLREADRRKDEFLATLAHELRNPLAPLANVAALLQRAPSAPEQVTYFGQVIERQTKAMAVLLDDLLEVSRISTGKLQLKKKVVSVASVIESALEPVRPALETREHELRVEMSGAEALLQADPVRLPQVLTNLLTNAIRYSDPGTPVTLRARADADAVSFEVEDTGIGLSAEQIPTIFTLFSQAAPIERAEGGLGIGLALAKALVEMHGGRIDASSSGLGKGSKFTVVVPRGVSVFPEAEVPLRAAAMVRGGVRGSVLIADDNVDAVDTLATLLRLDGYDVHVAYDGLKAVELANAMKPLACFIDIGMPAMNGLEVAKRLKASFGSRMLLVATTGWGQPEDRRRSKEAGFDLHMTKPIDAVEAARVLADRRLA